MCSFDHHVRGCGRALRASYQQQQRDHEQRSIHHHPEGVEISEPARLDADLPIDAEHPGAGRELMKEGGITRGHVVRGHALRENRIGDLCMRRHHGLDRGDANAGSDIAHEIEERRTLVAQRGREGRERNGRQRYVGEPGAEWRNMRVGVADSLSHGD